MKCFVCQKAAQFSFRWPWSTVLLAVCKQHTTEVTKKARAQACRVPELEPITVPASSPAPLAPPPAPHVEQPRQNTPPVRHQLAPATTTSVGEGAGRGSIAGDETPPPPTPFPPFADALVTISKGAFTIRRPAQHDTGGTVDELVVTLAALGLVPAFTREEPPTRPPPRQLGTSPGEFSHPGQVTPPNAASALAGAGSGAPAQPRGARPPVNPPMGGMGINPVHRGPFRPVHPAAPLGAVSTVSAAPGGQPPTPPPVALPMAAPVAPDTSSGGGPEPEGGSVVEGEATRTHQPP